MSSIEMRMKAVHDPEEKARGIFLRLLAEKADQALARERFYRTHKFDGTPLPEKPCEVEEAPKRSAWIKSPFIRNAREQAGRGR